MTKGDSEGEKEGRKGERETRGRDRRDAISHRVARASCYGAFLSPKLS